LPWDWVTTIGCSGFPVAWKSPPPAQDLAPVQDVAKSPVLWTPWVAGGMIAVAWSRPVPAPPTAAARLAGAGTRNTTAPRAPPTAAPHLYVIPDLRGMAFQPMTGKTVKTRLNPGHGWVYNLNT